MRVKWSVFAILPGLLATAQGRGDDPPGVLVVEFVIRSKVEEFLNLIEKGTIIVK